LRHELGFQARHIVSANHIGAGGGNPNLAFDIDHRVGIEFFAVGIIGDGFSRIFQRNQSGNIDALGIENGAARVGRRDQDGAFFAEKACGVFADRAEALDNDARSFEFEVAILERRLDASL